MNPKEILESIETIDINDIKMSDIDITEVELRRVKNNINKVVNDKNKHKKKRVLRIALLGLVVSLGIISTPAVAANIPFLNDIYIKLGFFEGYEDCANYIGETKEENGYKVTVDSIVATPERILVGVKVESEIPLERDMKKDNFNIYVTGMPSGTASSGSCNSEYLDDNTVILTYEEEVYGAKYPKKGDLELRVQKNSQDMTEQYMNLKFSLKVDFKEAFKKIEEIKVNEKINEDIKVDTLKSDVISSVLTFKPVNKGDSIEGLFFRKGGPKYFIEIDGKIHITQTGGGSGDTVRLNFETINKDIIDNAEEINIVYLTQNPVKDESEYEYLEEKVQENNIKYTKSIDSPKGLKGEFYEIEKNDKSIRFYFKSQYEAMAILDSIDLFEGPSDKIRKRHEGVAYKNDKEENSYIIEYTNVNPNAELELMVGSWDLGLDNFNKPERIKIK